MNVKWKDVERVEEDLEIFVFAKWMPSVSGFYLNSLNKLIKVPSVIENNTFLSYTKNRESALALVENPVYQQIERLSILRCIIPGSSWFVPGDMITSAGISYMNPRNLRLEEIIYKRE